MTQQVFTLKVFDLILIVFAFVCLSNLNCGQEMSLSKNTSADVKRDQGLMFLRDLKQSGMLEDLLNVISRESTGCAASGAMTDAPKRRCPDESASHD